MTTITKHELFSKLGDFKKVQNCQSASSYRDVPNQFILYFENGEVFQSYSSMIAARLYGSRVWYFTDYHDYSVTTAKYCNQFCGWNTPERRRMLKDGDAVWIEG